MLLKASLAITASLLLAAELASGAEPPDEGFLEFLGMLVEDNGDYLDPLDVAELELPEAESSAEEETNEETEEGPAEELARDPAEENADE